ncbi:MAG TPA: hypothetical protein VD970_19925, partial [Acetobacteraceae bacterium]|nr:hypothetical protein [Acetobacteraceae bacterium]
IVDSPASRRAIRNRIGQRMLRFDARGRDRQFCERRDRKETVESCKRVTGPIRDRGIEAVPQASVARAKWRSCRR